MKRNDLLTGEPFIAKRINHKFAKSSNRIKFHNRKATKLRHSVAHINKPLHQNLKILNDIMAETMKKKFHREWLAGKGFNYGVMTHFTEGNDEQIKCIYDFCITPHRDDSNYIIISRIKKETNA
jgi:hypothetical protein